MLEALSARRPIDDQRRVPAWSTPPAFERYGDYLEAQGVRAIRQADYGFQWRHDRGEPGRRLSWIPETGDLILVGPFGSGVSEMDLPVEVLAQGLLTEEDVAKAIPRWAHAHNTFRDSLGYLRRVLAKRGHQPVPEAFQAA